MLFLIWLFAQKADMKELKLKQKCPCCRQLSGVDIVYGSIDRLSEVLRSALKDGSVMLGGASARWDWEEELIDTKCLQCQHEWHGWHKRVAETSE
jgi:hypothetical protein